MSTPVDPTISQGRLVLASGPRSLVAVRMGAWFTLQVTLSLFLCLFSWFATRPEYALAAAVGLAASFSVLRPRSFLFAPASVAGALALAALAMSQGVSGLWAAGLVAGAVVAMMEPGRRTWRTVINSSLAGAILAPLGAAAGSWLASDLHGWLARAVVFGAMALFCSAVPLVTFLDWRPVARIPSPSRIRATLRSPHQETCLKAWEMDRALGRETPDRASREGLGEVAAWVYRLSVSLQAMDDEVRRLPEDDLLARITDLQEGIAATEDAYTRERRQATLRHLRGLQEHRQALAIERQRMESLIEYALATLEEARTALAYARQRPGQLAPEGIGEALDRLRSYSTQEAARRHAARELEAVP